MPHSRPNSFTSRRREVECGPLIPVLIDEKWNAGPSFRFSSMRSGMRAPRFTSRRREVDWGPLVSLLAGEKWNAGSSFHFSPARSGIASQRDVALEVQHGLAGDAHALAAVLALEHAAAVGN